MRPDRATALAVLAAVIASAVPAQQPTPPALPAINPANARLEQTLGGLDGPGVAVAASDQLGLLLAACEGRALHYWTPDLLVGVRASDEGNFRLHGHAGPVLAVVAGGGAVASAGPDGKILLWAPPSDKARLTLDAKGPVRGLALSPDGKTLAAGGEDGAVQLWETDKGQPGARIDAAKDWQRALAFSPDGKVLAAGGHDGKWRLFEVPSGKKLAEAEALAPPMTKDQPRDVNIVTAVAFAPDGKSVAVGGFDGQVYQFQADGKFVRAIPGHTAGVTDLAFHPGGALLVSASKDRTVRLWNPTNGQAVKTLEGHAGWVRGVAFYNKATRLASVGADRTVKLWDLSDPAKK